jgi:hypothetical protein
LLADVVEHRFEIGHPGFGQRGTCMGFGQSCFTPGYGSFPHTVPRTGILGQGRVNSVQFAGLDCPLAKLIPPCTDPACLDTSQD